MIDFTKVNMPNDRNTGRPLSGSSEYGIPESPWNPQPAAPAPPNPPATPPATPAPYDPRGTYGTNLWTDWNHTNTGMDPSWVQQQWYRNPSWAPHNIWNPTYGFQNINDIEKLYAQAGQAVTPEMFAQWGLTPQMAASFAGTKSPEWRAQYGQGGTSNAQPYFAPPSGETNNTGWTEGFQMPESQPFPFPQQWNTASNVFTNFAQGLPTSTESWWQAQQAPFERTISDQAKQLAEQMGLMGLRYSTPMGRNIADITGREANKLYSNLATQQLGLTEAAKNRGMQAAGALTGLGQQYLNAPQEWAQRMYQMGSGMTSLGQQALQRAYQNWMRGTPEGNPWLSGAMNYAGMQSQMMPQQYQPSFLSQLLGLGGGVLGAAGMAGGFGNLF